MQARDCITVGPIIMSRGRKRTFNSLEYLQQKLPACAQPEQLAFMNTELRMGYGPPICAAWTIYVLRSRAAHRQHTVVQVWEARVAQPEELLAAIPMLTARSEATSTTVDVEKLRAIGQ